jgi:hypothetical protein
MAECAATQLIAIFSGQPAPRPVNPEVLPRFRERYLGFFGGDGLDELPTPKL